MHFYSLHTSAYPTTPSTLRHALRCPTMHHSLHIVSPRPEIPKQKEPSRGLERGTATERRPRSTCLEIHNDRLDSGVRRQHCGGQTRQGNDHVPSVEENVSLVCKNRADSQRTIFRKRDWNMVYVQPRAHREIFRQLSILDARGLLTSYGRSCDIASTCTM
jgi:hypothetical protein